MEDIRALMGRFPRSGRLLWIGVRGQRRGPVLVVDETQALAGIGLLGDHYRPGAKGSRQVTLIQAEHLPVIAALCGRIDLDPGVLRLNLVVSRINLRALKGMRFRVGAALLEGTGRGQDGVSPARAWRKSWGRGAITPCGGTANSLRESSRVDRFAWGTPW